MSRMREGAGGSWGLASSGAAGAERRRPTCGSCLDYAASDQDADKGRHHRLHSWARSSGGDRRFRQRERGRGPRRNASKRAREAAVNATAARIRHGRRCRRPGHNPGRTSFDGARRPILMLGGHRGTSSKASARENCGLPTEEMTEPVQQNVGCIRRGHSAPDERPRRDPMLRTGADQCLRSPLFCRHLRMSAPRRTTRDCGEADRVVP